EALTRFGEQLRSFPTPEAQRARAMVLEELAARSSGVAASRARLEAARAYQEAGDRDGARRMLGNVGTDADAAVTGSAAATLIGVLVGAGRRGGAGGRLA